MVSTYAMRPEISKSLRPGDCLIENVNGLVEAVDTVLAAHLVTQKYHILEFAENRSTYLYSGGVYVPYAREFLEGELIRWFEPFRKKNMRPVMNTQTVREILNIAFTLNRTDMSVLDRQPLMLNVPNGLIDLTTGELTAHNPEIISLSQIEAVYSPKAECPRFMEYLDGVIDSKYHPALQEMFGYTLWPGYPLHKAFMLYGPPRTGKSTMLGVIRGLLGSQAVSTVDLQRLTGANHVVWELFGKRANIHGDLPRSVVLEPSEFKVLTGGDTVRGEQKFKDGFSFNNQAKIIYGSNYIPALRFDDDAFYKRWVIFQFKRSFEETGDSRLKEKLTEPGELSGILNWSLEGLERLRSNDFRMSYHDNGEALYRRLSRPIVVFLEEMTEEDEDARTSKDELFKAYRAWCRSNGTKPGTKNAFGRKLRDMDFEDGRIDGGAVWAWFGISLKE